MTSPPFSPAFLCGLRRAPTGEFHALHFGCVIGNGAKIRAQVLAATTALSLDATFT